jgi:hypothetical protein
MMLSILIVVFMLTSMVGTGLAQVTVDPATNDFELPYEATASEDITVTIPAMEGISQADIYLLADTTGSMGGYLAAVIAGADSIVDGVIAANPGVDIQFGAGDYKDFPYDSNCFNNAQGITANTTAVKTAINGWFASGGNDGSEGQFYAYDRIADPTNPVGWRAGSKKILLVFGDAPAHDPICATISSLGYNITEASVTEKLQDAGIVFIGLSTITGSFYPAGLDDDPNKDASDYSNLGCTPAGTTGQATRIAAATSGIHLTGADPAAIVSEIIEQIETAVTTISSLSLVPTGDITQFVAGITPASFGPLDSDAEHVLTFNVSWEGTVAETNVEQIFTGTLDVVADGSVIGSKDVTITLPRGIADVCIDIKPYSCPNSISLKNKGNIPVAVLGSDTFDVSLIDPGTVELEGVPALEIGGGLEDVNADGYMDIVFHFATPDLVAALTGATEATLTGQTTDGDNIEGSDSVRILN